MSRANKQRRSEKRRKEQRRAGGRPWSGRGAGWGFPFHADVGLLASVGAQAAAHGDAETVAGVVARLAGAARRDGVEKVSRQVCGHAGGLLAALWEGGWMPAEAVRMARRRASARHGDVVVAALCDASPWQRPGTVAPPEWEAQLAELGVDGDAGDAGDDWLTRWAAASGSTWDDAVRTLLEALGALMTLPRLEALAPRPSEWGSAAAAVPHSDAAEATLAKIRALLAKAESTSFDAEAEALTAKAQQLMARHCIEEAVARSGGPCEERPASRRLLVDDPYAAAKGVLLDVVAGANRVRSIAYSDLGMVAIVGFPSDLEAVEMLFTSLLVQATRAMVAKGRRTDARGRSRTRSFRQSFLVAYAGRIRERLDMAARQAQAEAESDLGRSVLPVLAGRDAAVDDEVGRRFPHLVTRRGPGVTNEEGWRWGRAAAELATLGPVQGTLAGVAAE